MLPLADALRSLSFAHASTVYANTTFADVDIPSIYLEPEAPPLAQWAWARRPHRPLQAVALPVRGRWVCAPSWACSAPPLGGLATGTVELRADGSLHAWTIENASPAGSTKTAVLDDAVFGTCGRQQRKGAAYAPARWGARGAVD